MRTFATLTGPGAYTSYSAGDVLVGRMVANAEFIRALARHGHFKEFRFYVGEAGDVAPIQKLFEGGADKGLDVHVDNILELPRAIESSTLDVLHHNTHISRFFDLVWLRNARAKRALPLTAQIHTLSYPRSLREYLASFMMPPSESDAIICSSESGQRVVSECFGMLHDRMQTLGMTPPTLNWKLPVIPLGVEPANLRGGDRAATRKRLRIPENAFVVLGMGRFTEYDKMDLFPVVQAFASLSTHSRGKKRVPYLILAGARQGTKTPEMVGVWAKAHGVEPTLRLEVDFPEAAKKDLLAAADVFVSATDNPQETFGLSVVEAMAAGLPCIASDFDGYRESVTDDVGIRVPTRWNSDLSELEDMSSLVYERPLHLFLGQLIDVDLIALSSALRELYDDETRARTLGENAAKRVVEKYAWQCVIPQYEALWESLARTAAPVPGPLLEHPMGLGYRRVFERFPTHWSTGDEKLMTTDFGRKIAGQGNNHPIYPEFTNVIRNEDVAPTLSLANQGITARQLVDQVASNTPDRSRWRASALVAWLTKHGLLRVQ